MSRIGLRHSYFRVRAWLGRPRIVKQVKPVILSSEDRCRNPIFIIGLHRSGTSLVRRILNSHTHVACPPETFFLSHFAAMVKDGNTMGGFEGLGFDKADVNAEIGRWAAFYHEAYRLAQGKRRWADKTPQYVAILPELRQIFGPLSRFVIIWRHPMDIVYSQSTRGWRFGEYHTDVWLNNAYYVRDGIGKIVEFVKTHPEVCHVLYYELLVSEPERKLRELMTFLNEPWEPGVMKFYEQEHGFGTEDPVVRGTKGFVQSFGNWRSMSEAQRGPLLEILGDTLHRLGYRVESDFPSA
jgi:hypothetical protein